MTFEAQLGTAEKWILIGFVATAAVVLVGQMVRLGLHRFAMWRDRRDYVNRIARTYGVRRRWYESDEMLAERMRAALRGR